MLKDIIKQEGELFMKTDNICVPVAVQLVLDDVGWIYGRDQRSSHNPSRTGMPRYHVLEDYQVLEAVGKAANMKINVMFVIGEWDRRRTLAKIPNSTKWGKDWNGVPYFVEKDIEEIRDYLNSCEYVELGFHGLLHDMWDDEGKFLCNGEFFPPEGMRHGAPRHLGDEQFLRDHFDAFYEIYNDWGLKATPRTFASPCGARDALPGGVLTRVLNSYGIQFWHNGGPDKEWKEYGICGCCVQNGVITNQKMMGDFIPWEAYDVDPDVLPTFTAEQTGILGAHWPNLLRFNPAKNLENVDAWARFLQRQGEVFGAILARDIAFAHYQQLYHYYSEVREENGALVIDLTKADAILPGGIRPDLYINVKKDSCPFLCEGGVMTEYETRNDFVNYQIQRTGASVIRLKNASAQ